MWNNRKLFYKIVKTEIGNIAILWSKQGTKPKIIQVILPKFSIRFIKKKYPDISSGRNREIDRVASEISNYISGKDVRFTTKLPDLKRLKNFQKKVLKLTIKIPKGSIATYGSIAKKLGIPRGARAVGQALANNPFPIIIPCHRVIRSDGSIGGFGDNIGLKRKLLRIEGVYIK